MKGHMTATEYARYLRTATWQRLRNRRLEMARGVCEVCHLRPATDVHHITYARVGGDEWLDDLVACCRICHTAAPSHVAWRAQLERERQRGTGST